MAWSHRIGRFKAGLQQWDFQWWFNVPILVFPVNFVTIILTGGGHAPHAFYVQGKAQVLVPNLTSEYSCISRLLTRV